MFDEQVQVFRHVTSEEMVREMNAPMSCVSPAKEWFALFVGCKLIFTSNSAVSANDVCRHFENILDTDRKLVLTSLDCSATASFIKSRNDLQSKINRPAFLLTMPTSTNIDDSKAAKKAAAQAAIARARQRDEMRATLSPATKTPAPTAATPGPKPTTKTPAPTAATPGPKKTPRRTSTKTTPSASNEPSSFAPPSETATRANTRSTRRSSTAEPASVNVAEMKTETTTPKRKAGVKDSNSQGRTTPSKDSLAQARAKARDWSIQQKKAKGVTGDARFVAVPDLVETEVVEDVEVPSDYADDFKTADEPGTNASANIAPSKAWKRNATLINKDMKNVLDRMQYVVGESNELKFIKNDLRNICDRMQHLCDNDVNTDESRAMDLD